MYFTFSIKIFFYCRFRRQQNQKLSFGWKFPFNLAAERSEAAHKSLTFTKMCPQQESNLQPYP